MAENITLTNIATFQNDTTATTAVNANNATITTALADTLSRTGTAPNQMGANLDMNNKRIINLPNPISNQEPLRLQDLASFTGGALSSFPSGGTAGQLIVKNSATNFDARWGDGSDAIEYVIDGQGIVITTGLKGYLVIPYSCTITQATLLGNLSGSIVLDIWKCTYAQFDAGSTHPLVGDSITAAAKPTISAAVKAQDSTLTGWTKTITAGDILAFNVNSCSGLTRAVLALKISR